jgi:glycosyltransferase involved in cell wall biosynthesis/SAM-dependent methyltransferase
MPKVIYGTVRVLELIHSSGITGPSRIVLGLARNIDREEFRLDVLCPEKGELPDDLREAGTRVIPLDWQAIKDPVSFFKLAQELGRGKYHIFHIHSGQLNAFTKIMAWILRVPAVILTEHLAVSDHRWIKNKAVLSLHLFLHRFSDMLVDKVIAVSEASRRAFIVRQGISPAKVETIYNGVNLEETGSGKTDTAGFKARLGVAVDAPIVALIGRLSPEKGHAVFVMAAQEIARDHPDARFVVIGEGPQRKNIEKLIAGYGLEGKFVLTGFIKDVAGALEAADIIVQPSFDDGESFGLTVVEAMAKAKPVILSDIGCFREIISEGKDGLLFPAGDHVSLAQKMRLLLGDGRLRETLGREGQKTVRRRFDIRLNAAATQQAYKRLLKQKGFIIYRDHIREISRVFLDSLSRGYSLSSEKLETYRNKLEELLAYIQERKHTGEEIANYLSGQHFFLIERFVQFIEAGKFFPDPVFRYNCRLFKRQIKAWPVSDLDYDQRIEMQNEQFQIDNYYQPNDPALKARVELILSFVEARKGERVLDVGCGVGTFAYHCAKRGSICAGVDYSRESLDMAQRLINRFGLAESVIFKQCDVSNGLPFEDRSFDKIVSADFIEHIDRAQKEKLLSEIHRLLKPEGKAVIFTPNLFREKLGALKESLSGMLGGSMSETRLHFGLTGRFNFEKLLRSYGFSFRRVFLDVDRPYLARIPVLKEVLSLNLLWVIEKKKDNG